MKKYRYDNTRVIETSTKYVIKKCASREDAKKLAGKLNGGTGFNGETPKFFVYAKDQKWV